MRYVSAPKVWAVAAVAVTAAALGCLASAAPAAADNSGSGPRRPLVAEAGSGNLARPLFPDGINAVAV